MHLWRISLNKVSLIFGYILPLWHNNFEIQRENSADFGAFEHVSFGENKKRNKNNYLDFWQNGILETFFKTFPFLPLVH